MQKQIIALVLIVLLVSMVICGCATGNQNTEATNSTTTAALTQAAGTETQSTIANSTNEQITTTTESSETLDVVKSFTALLDKTEDSSDLPDWTGKQMTFSYWNTHGTGNADRPKSSDDVVSPEVKRVTGIYVDPDRSYDNGGQDFPSKMAILAATNDWPDVAYVPYNNDSIDLIQADKIYDLTDLIPIYCPHIYQLIQTIIPPVEGVAGGFQNTGKYYAVPMNFRADVATIQSVFPNADLQKLIYVAAPPPRLGWNTDVFVRDDILKMAYPTAKTQKEIQDLYVKQGYFTREDLYDVPINTKEDAIEFFYKIKKVIDDNNITENGRPVYSTFGFAGQDNWALLACLLTAINGLPNVNYFTYFNTQTNHLDIMLNDEWFKQDVLIFNKFVRDNIVPQSSLIENNEIFTNKLNNGEYAISYAWLRPDAGVLLAADKPYQYRKVFFDIQQDTSYALNAGVRNIPISSIAIFKDKVSEEDLPQVLMWLDYLASDIGMKLEFWGPRSAGLYEDTPDGRRYTIKELEDCMINDNIANKEDMKYGLNGPNGKPWPMIPDGGISSGGIWYPKYVYNMTEFPRDGSQADNFFLSGLFDQQKYSYNPIISKTPDIWSFTDEVPLMKQFWDVRGTGFEPTMTQVLAASDDAEFETLYANMLRFAEENGLNDQAIADAEKLMQDKYPFDWNTFVRGY